MAKHAKFSPSSADRWMRCTASFYEHKPDLIDSPYALEGTSAHDLAAKILEGETTLEEWKGKKYDHVKLTPENMRALQYYIDEVGSLLFLHSDPTVLVEHRLPPLHEVWGTSDHSIMSMSRLDVTDLKFGKGIIVEANNNFQLLTYLSLAAKELYEDRGLNMPDTMCTRIIQPRARTGELGSEHYYSPEDVKAFRKSQHDRIKEIKQGKVSYNPSDKACQWCSAAKDGCRAYNEFMLNKAGLEFAAYVEETEEVLNPKVDLVPKLKDEEILRIFRHKTAFNNYIKAIEEAAIERQKNGAEFEGMKLVQSNTWLQITDEDALDASLRDFNIERSLYVEEKFLSPSQLRTKFKKYPEEVKDVLEEHFHQPPGEARLVSTTSKGRPYETD